MFVLSGFLVAVPMLMISVAADSWFYGKLTFTPWNFVKFNVIDEGSDAFGVDPWHVFFTKIMQDYIRALLLILPFSIIIYNYIAIRK